MKKVLLKDIAKKVEIGTASVSKALRDSKDISPETIKKVKKVAREMGYYPNIAARNLVSKKSYIIGVLLPEILSSHHSHVVNSFYKMARSRGYEVILMVTNENSENENHCLRYLASLPVDGIIATIAEETTHLSAFEEIDRSGTPIAFFGRDVKDSSILTFYNDDYFWASKIMDYLLSEGHKKIAFLGPYKTLYSSEQKFEAYRDCLIKKGIKVSSELVRSCKINDEDGYSKTKEMLSKGVVPDAMMCANDMVAIGAAKALMERGLKIPQDVALAGFGNLVETSILNVPISTVDYYPEQMGKTVMDRLIDIIEFGKTQELDDRVLMEASLVIRT